MQSQLCGATVVRNLGIRNMTPRTIFSELQPPRQLDPVLRVPWVGGSPLLFNSEVVSRFSSAASERTVTDKNK